MSSNAPGVRVVVPTTIGLSSQVVAELHQRRCALWYHINSPIRRNVHRLPANRTLHHLGGFSGTGSRDVGNPDSCSKTGATR
jgi:hypothetical protein